MSLTNPWTSAQLATELGLSSSFTSTSSNAIMGFSLPYTSAQVAAYSAGVTVNLVISSNTWDYNIYSAAVAANSAVSSEAAFVTVTIDSGVIVFGTNSYSGGGVMTGTGWHTGSTITIINNGTILGASGYDGNQDNSNLGSSANGQNGAAGGIGLQAQYAVTYSGSGVCAGGGGQGGFGGSSYSVSGDNGAGGGGGRGAGGYGQGASYYYQYGTPGGAGTTPNIGSGTPGAGQDLQSSPGQTPTYPAAGNASGPGAGGGGAAGGGYGAAGGTNTGSGKGTNASGTFITVGGTGGAAGLAVSGKSYVNSGSGVTTGTVYGPQS